MINLCTIAILEIMIIAFSDCSFAQDMSKNNEVAPFRKHKFVEYKAGKKNCDLCINLHPKQKIVHV